MVVQIRTCAPPYRGAQNVKTIPSAVINCSSDPAYYETFTLFFSSLPFFWLLFDSSNLRCRMNVIGWSLTKLLMIGPLFYTSVDSKFLFKKYLKIHFRKMEQRCGIVDGEMARQHSNLGRIGYQKLRLSLRYDLLLPEEQGSDSINFRNSFASRTTEHYNVPGWNIKLAERGNENIGPF